MKLLKHGIVFVLLTFVLLSVTGCAGNKNTFTVDAIRTENVGFAGIGGSIAPSSIYLEGKRGRDTIQIKLTKAFGDLNMSNFSGEYSIASAFNPDIKKVSFMITDENGDTRNVSITPGDKFSVDESYEDRVVLCIPEKQ